MRVTLYVANGQGFPVHETNVPKFAKPPEVLIWGGRVFSYHATRYTFAEPVAAVYYEVFAFTLPSEP